MTTWRGALELSLACLALVAMAAPMAACRSQSVEPRSRFVEDGVSKEASADWDGGTIEVDTAGVTPGGGLELLVGDNRVRAKARMLAVADTEDKKNADLAIVSAKETYQITTNGTVTSVRCGHGMTFASAAAHESGCDALDVSLPPGTAEMPLLVTARSGNGIVVATLGGAMLGMLDLHGSHGNIDVTTPSRPGATITIVSETGQDVVLRLPADFAADAIALEAPRVDTTAFPDLQLGKGRGEPGRGAKRITVRGGAIVLAIQ